VRALDAGKHLQARRSQVNSDWRMNHEGWRVLHFGINRDARLRRRPAQDLAPIPARQFLRL
jgi:hypothetical protein